MTNRKPIAISLFTGAGGLDLGIEQARYSVVYAVENDETAVATLNKNRAAYFPDLAPPEPLDITTLDPDRVLDQVGVGPGEVDLLFGGPPCVAFSKSGFHLEYKRAGRDPRAGLLGDYFRFLRAVRPKAFILENVFGLAYRNQSKPFFDQLTEGIEGLGYSLQYGVLNAADFGVPQNRQRLFVVGAADNHPIALPLPTHWGEHERRRPPAEVDQLLPHVTTGDILKGLRTKPEAEEQVNGKYGHLLPEIPPGRNYLHYTAHEGHPNPLFEWRSRYWTFLLKLDPKRPASTLQGQPGPDVGPFHWRNRRLRAPELKRLQGFPDDFQFAGNRRAIQLQVGNSVPPGLGAVVASAVRMQLAGELPPGTPAQIDLAA
jgi:DNA (cytosine-5)-methyltransferase 1